MPDDATESVAEHSSRLQPSINLHAQLQPLCSAALVPNVLPRRDEGSGKPCAVIISYVYLPARPMLSEWFCEYIVRML